MRDFMKIIGTLAIVALAACGDGSEGTGGSGGDGGGGTGGDGGIGGTGGGTAGTGGTGDTCAGNPTGVFCDWDSDCSSDNCYDDQCYGTSAGNPCDWDSDCDSGNCYDDCCQPDDAAFVDDTQTECEGAVDRLADCGIVRQVDVAVFKTALCASGQVDPYERDLFVSCIYSAANCEQMEGCAGTSGPCTVDTDCHQTPGLATHEICDPLQNNYCRLGCRDDADCGANTCDTFLNVCNPW